ncbi:MAG: hypothetical protein J6J24_04730, partial [Clostridia bacterium]|nr:hypothetical protein [Clostridia bacterium]
MKNKEVKTVKKANSIIPKFFKFFAVYLMLTMSVFFGYVQLFGNLKPQEIQLPTDDTQASDETLFSKFVESFSSFDNIDTDFVLSLKNSDIDLALDGNVVFDTENSGLKLNDFNIEYNGDKFLMSAVYLNPYLYLSLDQGESGEVAVASTNVNDSEDKRFYKFNVASSGGSADFGQVFEFIMETFNIDTGFVDSISDYIGVDLRNFNPNDLLAKLKIDEKQRDNGEVVFNITLNSISAQIICDENFVIKSVDLLPLLLQGNQINFNANVNKMNKEEIFVDYEEGDADVDLTAINDYVGYAENLFENQYVKGNVVLNLGNENYFGTLLYQNVEGPQVRLNTQFDGIDVSVAFANDNVYLSVADLRFFFAIEDYATWKGVLDEIFLKHTNQTAAQYIKGLIEAYVGIDFDNVEVKDIVMSILSGGFANSDKLEGYLPDASVVGGDSFEMIWQNGLNVTLYQQQELLSKAEAVCGDKSGSVEFVVENSGFELVGEYYDISELLPLSAVVDSVLETNQFGGAVSFKAGDEVLAATYFVDFSNGIYAEFMLNLLGEDIKVVLSGKEIFVCIGEIVISGNVDEISSYLASVDSLFGTKSQLMVEDLCKTETIFGFVFEMLDNLSLGSAEGKVALIYFLNNLGTISIYEEDKAMLNVVADAFEIDIQIMATNNSIQKTVANGTIEDVLDKLENVYNYIETRQYAFAFDIDYNKIALNGTAQVDLAGNKFAVSGLTVGNDEMNLAYANGVVYVEYAGQKIKASVASVEELVAVIMPIVNANLPAQEGEGVATDTASILNEIFGEDVTKLTIAELLDMLKVS